MDAEPVPQSFLDRIRRIDDTTSTAQYAGLDTPYPEEEEYFANELDDKMRIMVTIPGGLERLSCLELASKFGNESGARRFLRFWGFASIPTMRRSLRLRGFLRLEMTHA